MYQQDIFYECTVNRNVSKSVKVFGYIAAGFAVFNLFITLVFLVVGGIIFLIPTILFALLSYFELQNATISFDYSYTNGEIDIDKVSGGKKRKNIVNVMEGDIVVLAPTHTDPVLPYVGKKMPTKDCTSHTPGKNYYVMIAKDSKTERETKIIFEPSVEILDILWRMNPSRVTLSDEDRKAAAQLA